MKVKLQSQNLVLKPIILILLAFYLPGSSLFLKTDKLEQFFSLDKSQSQHQKQLFVRVIPDVDNVKNS